MAILQYSDLLRNNQLDQIEATLLTAPLLTIRTGPPPANCAAANLGTVLATLNLPSDWMNPAAGGSKTMLGSWTDNADNAGVAGHFRLHNTAGTVCHMQGDITATGGGGAMTVDNVNFAVGQSFSINTFSITAGNA